MTDLFSLDGRVALVTGGSRGLGFAMAKALAAAGAHVVICARGAEALDEAAAAIAEAGGSASVLAFDVTDEAAAVSAVRQIRGDHGRLDILINNAGTIHPAPAVETETMDWHRVIDTNLNALFVLSREAARPMIDHGFGRIISIASVLSLLARPGIPSYVTTKHAIIGLTKALAVELGPSGITANAIAPGYFRTEINVGLQNDPAFTKMIETRCPVGRWGEPDELAGTVTYLASDAAAFVNGHTLVIDGGLSISL